ncbi:hypothetical protein Csa_004808 [Cucumis sativus]|uniref:Uncharacterized protein n=1 Tax=Cucumis sativus TaxID=3659 RepID=A0A0A0KD60_CUCSA|nr:hypothetical protein Csa_004808 [Cucumis sativus]
MAALQPCAQYQRTWCEVLRFSAPFDISPKNSGPVAKLSSKTTGMYDLMLVFSSSFIETVELQVLLLVSKVSLSSKQVAAT